MFHRRIERRMENALRAPGRRTPAGIAARERFLVCEVTEHGPPVAFCSDGTG